MFTIDRLYNLAMILRESPELRERLFRSLDAILATAQYGHWIDFEQFAEAKFRVPYQWPGEPRDKHLLEELGFIEEDELQVKIEKHGSAICLTDGLWVAARYRVFPFIDESARLMEYIEAQGIASWPDVIVDPACGSGHHSLYLSNVRNRISLDISVRALAYCVLNKYLNGQGKIHDFLIANNDIRRGIPEVLARGMNGRVLFVVNMPFAISPLMRDGGHTLPLSADGGEMGADLTIAAMEAIHSALPKLPAAAARACILNYSVGRSENGPWFIEEKARALFPDSAIRYTVLTAERMWRVNGKKEQPNPMPIELLSTKAECKYYVSDARRDETRIGYRQREQQLMKNGWKFLCYGLVDIDLRQPS